MDRKKAIETLYQVINSGILDAEIESNLEEIASTLEYHDEFEGNSRSMEEFLEEEEI